MWRRTGYRRDGFTLIELLVVISIIAVLMGLLIPAVQKVREAMNRGKNRDRMEQITNATNTFYTTETLGKPGYLPNATPTVPFRVRRTYPATGFEYETSYLAQLFPRINFANTGVQITPVNKEVDLTDNNQVAVFFLTGGWVTDFEGFSNNPQQPFALKSGGNEERKGRFIQNAQNLCGATATTSRPQFLDVYGTPYAIFVPNKQGNYAANAAFSGVSPFRRGATNPAKWENEKSLQIISAGPRKVFGTGGDWSGGVSADGRDDVSNFSTATLDNGPAQQPEQPMQLKAFPRRALAARRSGFTLIEMLVVISIVVIILGVGVGATMKFKDAATNRAADDQAKQLQIALNGQYETVVSQCNKEKQPPDAVLAYCGGDPDRARAVHAAATLRVYFPETFAEAANGATDAQGRPCSFLIGGHPYYAKAAFKPVAGSTGLTADQQSAALLYLILSEQAVGQGSGEVRSKEGTVKDSAGKDFKVFLDPWNTPIRFSRWTQHADLDVAPYAHANPSGSIDPLDPKSRVVTVTSTWTAAGQRDPLNAAPRNLQFVSRNRVPSVFSAGKDKTDPTDDRIGYKLNRQGASGK